MIKFLRVTEEDGLVIYIPIHSIKEITVEGSGICITYGDNEYVYPIESEAEIAQQLNQ